MLIGPKAILDPALGRDPTLFGSCAILGAAWPGVKAILGPALGRSQGYFGSCTRAVPRLFWVLHRQNPRLFESWTITFQGYFGSCTWPGLKAILGFAHAGPKAISVLYIAGPKFILGSAQCWTQHSYL